MTTIPDRLVVLVWTAIVLRMRMIVLMVVVVSVVVVPSWRIIVLIVMLWCIPHIVLGVMVVIIQVIGAVHWQVSIEVLSRLRRRQRRRHINRRDTSIDITIEVFQVQLFQVEKATEHRVGHLDFKVLQDDVSERDNDRIHSVQLQTDRVWIQHANLRLNDFDSMQAELANHQAHPELWLLIDEHFIGDVVQVQLDGQLLSIRSSHYPESEIDSGCGDHVRLGKAASEVAKVFNLVLKLNLFVFAVGREHAGEHNVQILSRQREVKRMGKLCFVVPALAIVDVQVRLKEGVNSLHADVRLKSVQVRIILEGHGREPDPVVISNALIKEKTFDAEGQTVQTDLGCLRSDNVQLPELVKEVQAAVGGCDRTINGGRKSHRDCLLVGSFNELDHGSLEEADEAASELRPDIAVQVHLDVLLRDHELHIDSLDGGERAPIEQLLRGKADSDLQLEALQLDVSMALGLHKALFELKMSAVERS